MSQSSYINRQPWESLFPGLAEFSNSDFFNISMRLGEASNLSQVSQPVLQNSMLNVLDLMKSQFDFANTKKASLHNINIDSKEVGGLSLNLGSLPSEEVASNMINSSVENLKPSNFVKESFLDKVKGFGSKALQSVGGVNGAMNILEPFAGQMDYSGKNGSLGAALDSGIDTVANFLPGPFGTILKGSLLMNKFLDKWGVGSLDMTKGDTILKRIPLLGQINSLGGKNIASFKKDSQSYENVVSSYSGSDSYLDHIQDDVAGKRLGILGNFKRNKFDEQVYEGRRQNQELAAIGELTLDRQDLTYGMSAINGNRRAFQLQGGYDLGSIRVGRNGLSLKTISTAKRIVSACKFKLNNETPTIEIEVPIHKEGGTLTEISFKDIPSEFLEESFVQEVSIDDILPEFKEGGKVNVIPEGALHARLHHMENADNLTKKGIPVVAEKEGGELEQQAEIEREEIIFRLEVTQKLEELQKKFYSEEHTLKEKDEFAIEAGKLLVHEILNNTIDNTNNLL